MNEWERGIGMWKSGDQEVLEKRELTERIIGAAISVHRALGPGFVEAIYEEALCVELKHAGLAFERQHPVAIRYREAVVGEHRLDLLVEQAVVVELKAVSELMDIHFAVVRSYMNALDLEAALLLNFAAMPLAVRRVERGRADAFLLS
jgi:GxxExxY protein